MAASNYHSPHIRCMWLDSTIHDAGDNERMQRRLCDIFGRCAFIDTKEKGQESIKRSPEQPKLLLVVSGQIGSQLVPVVHDDPKICAIYIYCGNVNNHIGWSQAYSKVKFVTDSPDQLIDRIKMDKPNL